MKKKLIAIALGMILTICTIALPIIGVSADTTNYNNLIISNVIEKTDVYLLKYNVWSTFSIQRTDETYSLNLNIDFFLIGNASVYIECYGKNDTLIEINFSTIEKFSGHYKNDINITSTTDIGRINLAFSPNEDSILYLGSFGDKTSIGLYNTYIIENNKLLDEFVDTNYNNGYESGLNYSKYGVFSDSKIIESHLKENNYAVPDPQFDYVYNGISFRKLALKYEEYCDLNSIDNYTFSVKLECTPFKWVNDNFYTTASYGYRTLTIYDINGKAYKVNITDSKNDYGYLLQCTDENSNKTTPNDLIQYLIIEFTNSDYCYPILYPTGSAFNDGYITGQNDGYYSGYQNGYNQGKLETSQKAYENGYQEGYSKGYNKGSSDQQSLYGYIAAIGEAPANMIQEMFNFEIMGVNVSTVIFALLTTALVVILLKKFT